ncbi:MAG: dTDP-glucose 4,6-dehydratase [Oligoflexia bacterium]|nr:dTDP-glucose 4,6-dehydratase [Oligoflexia bacterium]
MKNVLVTGGAGFIGSNFVRYALKHRADWKLHVLDLLTYAGNLENLADLIQAGQIQFIKADIADQPQIDAIFAQQRFDLTFHFAAESHVDRSILSATEFVRTNVLGTQVLLNALQAHTPKQRFVHVSTDEVYGSLGPTGRFLETTPLDPTSPYSASKAASDLMVLAAVKTHGLNAVVTRCTNNYGPYQFPEKFIPLFITNALEDLALPLYGDGMNVRSWLHVDDHAAALLAVGDRGRAGEVYNIGGAEESEIPNLIVAQQILKALKKPESLIKRVADRPAHDRRYAIDYTKINQELGWSPRIAFAQGLESTIRWFLDNKGWWRNIKTGEYLKYYERNYQGR